MEGNIVSDCGSHSKEMDGLSLLTYSYLFLERWKLSPIQGAGECRKFIGNVNLDQDLPEFIGLEQRIRRKGS